MELTHNIGILYADDAEDGLTHDFFAGVLNGFKNEVEHRGYNVSFINSSKKNPNRKSYIDQMNDAKYDGVLVACARMDDPEVKTVLECGLPIVTIDEKYEGAITVKSDSIRGVMDMVKYVAEMGHRRIAWISGDDNVITRMRTNCFRDTCAELGIHVPDEYMRQGKFRDMDLTAYLTEELLRLPDPPSCIFFSDDFAAIGGMNVIRARGLVIPDDISVVGFDGIRILSRIEPKLTTITQNVDGLGSLAATELIEWIEHPSSYQPKDNLLVPTILEKGRTVGRAYF